MTAVGQPAGDGTCVRVAALADLHGHLPPPEHLPACDLLLIAGDICPMRDQLPYPQRQWLQTKFARWLQRLPTGAVAGVAGNHDHVFAQEEELFAPALPWHYLQDSGAVLAGLAIYGTPWIPWMGEGWCFQGPDDGEEALREHFAAIPAGLDILLAHSPPYARGDLTEDGRLAGSRALREAVERTRPRLVVCGHIHEGRSLMSLGGTVIANVCSLDSDYRPVRPAATVFDIPLDRTQPPRQVAPVRKGEAAPE